MILARGIGEAFVTSEISLDALRGVLADGLATR
jgi:hypothetical protein